MGMGMNFTGMGGDGVAASGDGMVGLKLMGWDEDGKIFVEMGGDGADVHYRVTLYNRDIILVIFERRGVWGGIEVKARN